MNISNIKIFLSVLKSTSNILSVTKQSVENAECFSRCKSQFSSFVNADRNDRESRCFDFYFLEMFSLFFPVSVKSDMFLHSRASPLWEKVTLSLVLLLEKVLS